jgi:hypothetical protein
MRRIIVENIQEDKSTLQNGRAIAFLFFGLLNCVEDKQDFDFLPHYYYLFANNIGFLDNTLLLMLETASHCRNLVPSEPFMLSLLAQDIPVQFDPVYYMILCELILNYVCFDLSEDLYVRLSRWIEAKIKSRKFGFMLKKTLMKVITICLHY